MIDATVIRSLLILCLVGMAAFGFSYLSRRQLKAWQMVFYGAIILCLPLFGPFWVIALRPGKRRENVSPDPPHWFLWLSQKVNH
jgi:hypothetical protein